jgi:hypothetical protein
MRRRLPHNPERYKIMSSLRHGGPARLLGVGSTTTNKFGLKQFHFRNHLNGSAFRLRESHSVSE